MLGSAGLEEDPEGVSREDVVLESGDACSCWSSSVIGRDRRQSLWGPGGGGGGGCFAKGIDTAEVPQVCTSIVETMDGTELT